MAGWRDRERWEKLRDGTACPICRDSGPLGVLAESRLTWVTTEDEVACLGYACVVAKRHVVEPFELPPDEMLGFFADAAAVARAVNELFAPVKLNYEIHGNSIPHLHLHVFPRYVDDAFEGRPVRGSEHHVRHSPEDVERMAEAFRQALS